MIAAANQSTTSIPKPLRVVGYQRQAANCHWKLFVENNRDTYHGPQLHSFVPNFGLVNPAGKITGRTTD